MGGSLLEQVFKKSGWRGPREAGAQRLKRVLDRGRAEREEHGHGACKGCDAGMKVSGIRRHIAVDTQGLPHAIAVTKAEVTDRKLALSRVQALLCDSDYVGKPFAQGVQDILGAHVTAQIAKRS